MTVRDRLVEVSRKELVYKSRSQDKRRFNKRLNYQVSNFRGVDLKQMFENDYFVFRTPIGSYVCVVAFPGVFTSLRKVVKETNGDVKKINLQLVIKALRRAFDATDDVKVDCTCADWKYRYAYWATENGYKYGEPETRPSDKTNPDDSIGATCKHLNLLLSNKRWLVKAASVVNSFIKAYPDKAEKYLYDEEDLANKDSDDSSEDSDEVTSPFSDDKGQENETDQSDEESASESEKDEVVTDSLHLKEEDIYSDEEMADTVSSSGRDWIADQKSKLVDFNRQIRQYSKKVGLEDRLKFVKYNSFSRKENSVSYQLINQEGVSKNFWITYRDGRYVLVGSSGMPEKSNKDPQKIVKYLFDKYIY